jgi:tetratricopeptide (TPR) repeat protein
MRHHADSIARRCVSKTGIVGIGMLCLLGGGIAILWQNVDAAEQDTPKDAETLLETRITEHREALEKHPDEFEHRFQLARHLHLKGAAGDRDAAKDALRRFRDLHEAYPDKPVVTAYLGGAVLLSAKRQFFPWDKKEKLDAARELLNDAVDQAADSYQPRLLRGIAVAHLPESLGQADKAREDLKWAVDQAGQRLEDGSIDASDAAAAHFHFGRLLAENDKRAEARRHWQKATELAPTSYPGLRARASLADETD